MAEADRKGKARTPVGKGAAVSFLLVSIAFFVSGLLSFQNVLQLERNNEWVNHSLALLNDLRDAFNRMVEVEAEQRGYLLSSNRSFLTSFEDMVQATKDDFRNLQALTADSPSQQERLAILEPKAAARTAT